MILIIESTFHPAREYVVPALLPATTYGDEMSFDATGERDGIPTHTFFLYFRANDGSDKKGGGRRGDKGSRRSTSTRGSVLVGRRAIVTGAQLYKQVSKYLDE